MAITTWDGFIASVKQYIPLAKTASRTTVASTWFSIFDLAGNPGSGTLAGTSTTVGVVPNDATAGCPPINFSTGTGYLAQVDFGNTVAARMKIFDMLFKAGAYAFTGATTNLATQPSYSSRCPGSTDFTDTQIWIEVTTSFATGTAWQVQITYTNQSGTAAKSTVISVAQAAAGLTQGKLFQLALASGDSGVQKIESVIVTNGGTAMTAGNFNVLVLKPLWSGRVRAANDGDCHAIDKTALPIIYLDSALYVAVNADSTSTGIPEIEIVVASG